MKPELTWNALDPLIQWLLAGDMSIQYQTFRDLLGEERQDLQERIWQKAGANASWLRGIRKGIGAGDIINPSGPIPIIPCWISAISARLLINH